jgi:hypothetical protein
VHLKIPDGNDLSIAVSKVISSVGGKPIDQIEPWVRNPRGIKPDQSRQLVAKVLGVQCAYAE